MRPTANKSIIDGILNLNKPKDVTSMDVIRQVKRLTKVQRVGHAGTLDPIATGVLPICFGQATRLMEFLVEGRKIYRAEVTLGVTTDTYDAYGETIETRNWSNVTKDQVGVLLNDFVGLIEQIPPMFSAIKHEGKRLYALAREGIQIARRPREVRVHKLSLTSWNPPHFVIQAECGRGFYMRSLAHDLGRALDCGAHLSELTRLYAGTMNLEESITLEEFDSMVTTGNWRNRIEPPDFAVANVPALQMGPVAEGLLRNGQAVTTQNIDLNLQHLELRRTYTVDGQFIGLVRFDRAKNQWLPQKLFNLPNRSNLAPEHFQAHLP